jgi:hypothetical protein
MNDDDVYGAVMMKIMIVAILKKKTSLTDNVISNLLSLMYIQRQKYV